MFARKFEKQQAAEDRKQTLSRQDQHGHPADDQQPSQEIFRDQEGDIQGSADDVFPEGIGTWVQEIVFRQFDDEQGQSDECRKKNEDGRNPCQPQDTGMGLHPT